MRRRQLMFSWFFLDDSTVLCSLQSLFLSAAFLCWIFFVFGEFIHKNSFVYMVYDVSTLSMDPIFREFTFCVGVSILLMGDDAGIDFRRRTKLNRWQNQAIIQHKYSHLKRPGGAKWKLFIHNKWNTVHSRDVSVYSTKLYWIAMKENHCRGYLR